MHKDIFFITYDFHKSILLVKTHHKDNIHKGTSHILKPKARKMKTCREEVQISILESLGFPQHELPT